MIMARVLPSVVESVANIDAPQSREFQQTRGGTSKSCDMCVRESKFQEASGWLGGSTSPFKIPTNMKICSNVYRSIFRLCLPERKPYRNKFSGCISGPLQAFLVRAPGRIPNKIVSNDFGNNVAVGGLGDFLMDALMEFDLSVVVCKWVCFSLFAQTGTSGRTFF